MIIIFLALAFLHTLSHGLPILTPASLNVNAFIIRDEFTIGSDDASTRSTFDLVKSCIVTVLACVWTAGHPNIPGPRDSTWTTFKRQLITMIYALIAPEMMVLWAMRQRSAAKAIADDYNCDVLGLPRKEKISLWKHLWNWSKGSWGRGKEWFIKLPTIFARRQNGQALNAAVAALENTPKTGKLSSWKRLSDSFKMLWVSANDSLREMFIELPKARARRGKGQTWTTTHGFFIQMGGFLLYKNDYPKQVLDYDNMEKLIRNKQIDAPIYTEHDLKDRSKGDTISKGVVVLQTTWFVIQCVTRLYRGLPLSELEVVTLGFALLNGITYAVWWDKPQGVGLAIFIPLKEKGHPELLNKLQDELKNVHSENSRTNREEFTDKHKLTEAIEGDRVEADIRLSVDIDIEKGSAGSGEREDIAAADDLIPLENIGSERQTTDDVGSDKGATAAISNSNLAQAGGNVEGAFETARFIQPEDAAEETIIKKGWLRQSLQETWEDWPWLGFIIAVPFICFGFLLRPLWKMIDNYDIPNEAHRAPMFYADRRGKGDTSEYVSLMIGTTFGAVHLLAWSSDFPSRTEVLLWHISTLSIITVPVLLMMTTALDYYKDTRLGEPLFLTIGIFASFSLPLYIGARLTLMILAFLSLHTLPLSVFITIPWTSFIPHL